jgi:hypothetical protein
MSRMLKNKAFLLGFVGGIIFFVCFNIFLFLRSTCHHCVYFAGFPLKFYEEFKSTIYFNPATRESFTEDFRHFFEYNLIADVLFTIVFSFLIGLIFKFVWSKISARKMK